MSEACATHGPYLSALADDELELVPAATRQHVLNCADCTRELNAYRMLSLKLRDALPWAEPTTSVRPIPRVPRVIGRRLAPVVSPRLC